jgi:hypothetical protein
MALIAPTVTARLGDPKVQNLVLGSLALGVTGSVLGYWVWNEVKGEPRMPTHRAMLKGVAVSVASLMAVAVYESWKLQKSTA